MKVEAVQVQKQLWTPTEVRNFLGLAGHYRRFIQDYSKISSHLTKLTKKEEKFVWTSYCEEAFLELKKRLTSAPVWLFHMVIVGSEFTQMLVEWDQVLC